MKTLLDEQYPTLHQVVLKKLTVAAHAGFPRELIGDLNLREELAERLANNLYATLTAHVFGEKIGELTTTVELPVPQTRWSMFLWALCPARWRPRLKKKLGIKRWQQKVGFEQFRTYPSYVPAPAMFGGGRTGMVVLPIWDHDTRWIA
jgi:hypothetical protein